jgi:hypothetical protein
MPIVQVMKTIPLWNTLATGHCARSKILVCPITLAEIPCMHLCAHSKILVCPITLAEIPCMHLRDHNGLYLACCNGFFACMWRFLPTLTPITRQNGGVLWHIPDRAKTYYLQDYCKKST